MHSDGLLLVVGALLLVAGALLFLVFAICGDEFGDESDDR